MDWIQQFKEVISETQGLPINTINIDGLLESWREAKSDFINNFNGQLIYEFPEEVTFTLDEESKKSRLNSFIDSVYDEYGNRPLGLFIAENSEGFFSNQVLKDYRYGDKVIRKGTKLLKSFKIFEKNKEYLDRLQINASMIIQENKIHGKLCFSVHPLDFLSISENNYNWRSCHALDGDYRAGNLSYMLDKSTIICYLKSDEDVYLKHFSNNFKWNNKKWRMLLFFSEEKGMLFAGRQYPFASTSGLNKVLRSLKDCGLGSWQPRWYDKSVSYFKDDDMPFSYVTFTDKYYPDNGGHLVPAHELVTDESNLHYNDILNSTCYTPKYTFKRSVFSYSFAPARFYIGGKAKCVCCAENDIADSSMMTCIECEEKYGTVINDEFGYCPSCDRRFYINNSVYVAETEEYICDDCADKYIAYCSCCDESYYKIDMKRVGPNWICPYCDEGVED